MDAHAESVDVDLPGLAERLRKARSLRKISQQKLEQAAGLGKGHLSNILKREGPNLTARILFALARVLQVRMEWLISGLGPMMNSPFGDRAIPDAAADRVREAIKTLLLGHYHGSNVELAKALGIAPSTLASIRRGERAPSAEVAETVANLHGVDTWELIGLDVANKRSGTTPDLYPNLRKVTAFKAFTDAPNEVQMHLYDLAKRIGDQDEVVWVDDLKEAIKNYRRGQLTPLPPVPTENIAS